MTFVVYSIMGASSFIFVSYILASTFFYYFPHLLHNKNTLKNSGKKRKHLVVSHRGGAGENVENTLAAFEHSKSIGVDVFELDVHLTLDNQVVVLHDKNLWRCAGIDRLVNEMNYDDLPELLENQYVVPFIKDDGGDCFDKYHNTDSTKSKKIPLLEDIFRNYPKYPVNLDIKKNDDKLIEQVNYLIRKYQREDLTVWGSFDDNVNTKAYKLNPDVSLMFSLMGVTRLFLLHFTGLLPFIPLKETYFEIIMPNAIVKHAKNLPFAYRCALRLVQMVFIRKSFVRHLKMRGIMVYFWVLNTDEEFEMAFDCGANGIITDYPSKLIKFIDNYNSGGKQLRD